MEKKWFIHAQGRQEGPLSLSDLRQRLVAGSASRQDYAWNESMDEWKKVEDISELLPLLNAAPPKEPTAELSGITSIRPRASDLETPGFKRLRSVQKSDSERSGPSEADLQESELALRRRRGLNRDAVIVVLALVVLASGIGVAYSQGYLDPWLSPVMKIDELSQDENAELTAAAGADRASVGPTLAFALSQQNLSSPVVYVATNLPDGTNLDLRIHGLGPTLLNESDFELYIPMSVDRKLAKSPPIRMRDGSPIPAGQYQVIVTESIEQPDAARKALAGLQSLPAAQIPPSVPSGRKLLSKKVFTLLGGIREDTYSALLRDYHAKLRDQAAAEAREIGDWLGILSRSLDSSRATFDRLKVFTPEEERAKQWAAFHDDWLKELNPYLDKFDVYKPGAVLGKVFYADYYRMTYDLWQAVNRLHDLQTAYLTTQVDKASFDQELVEANKQVDEKSASIKAKMAEVQKAWSNTGYPPREGS